MIHGFEQTELVGAKVELHLRLLLARGVKLGLQARSIVFEITRSVAFVNGFAGDVLGHEGLVGNQHAAEILVLEGHPIHVALEIALLLGLILTQLLGVVTGQFVSQRGVLVLKFVALFKLSDTLAPVNIDDARIGTDIAVHSLGGNGEIQHKVVGLQGIDKVQLRTAIRIRHAQRDGIGCLLHYLKEEIACRQAAFLRVKGEGHLRVLLAIKMERLVLVVAKVVVTLITIILCTLLSFFQIHVSNCSALWVNLHAQLFVFNRDEFSRSRGFGEHTIEERSGRIHRSHRSRLLLLRFIFLRFLLRLHLLGGRLFWSIGCFLAAVVTKTKQHQTYEHKPRNCVFIHIIY